MNDEKLTEQVNLNLSDTDMERLREEASRRAELAGVKVSLASVARSLLRQSLDMACATVSQN